MKEKVLREGVCVGYGCLGRRREGGFWVVVFRIGFRDVDVGRIEVLGG